MPPIISNILLVIVPILALFVLFSSKFGKPAKILAAIALAAEAGFLALGLAFLKSFS